MTPRLKIPSIDFDEMFGICTDNIQDNEIRNKKRITEYLEIIKENNINYRFSMENLKDFVEKFNQPYDVKEYITFKADMNWLYTNKFVNKSSNGRQYYDLIKSNVKNKRCPYCLHSDIEDLDHYLPKSIYPSLSLTTENLVPACKTCNTKKLESKDLFPHPYYDVIDNKVFLKCKIEFDLGDKDIAFIYEIVEKSVSPELFIRIKNFADITERFDIYSVHATSEFNMKRISFIRLFNDNEQSLKNHLKDILSGVEIELGKNCWQAALYRGLLDNKEQLYKYLRIFQLEEEAV